MTRRTHDPSFVPDLILERYRLGEMTAAELAQFRGRLDADAGLRQRLRALDDSDEEISGRYPSGWLAERVTRRFHARVSGASAPAAPRRVSWKIPAVVATVAIVVFAVGSLLLRPLPLLPGAEVAPALEQGDRIKGHDLVLFRKTADGSEVLGDGALARAGDLIRIGYRATGRPYGVILSVDGRGSVTRHLPQQGDRAARLSRNGQVLLEHAYELDDAPRWECFYFVTGPDAFEIAPLLEGARTAAAAAGAHPPAALPLPGSLNQSSLVLTKEATR